MTAGINDWARPNQVGQRDSALEKFFFRSSFGLMRHFPCNILSNYHPPTVIAVDTGCIPIISFFSGFTRLCCVSLSAAMALAHVNTGSGCPYAIAVCVGVRITRLEPRGGARAAYIRRPPRVYPPDSLEISLTTQWHLHSLPLRSRHPAYKHSCRLRGRKPHSWTACANHPPTGLRYIRP